jgi:Domain of unknown function (DUF4282)
MGDFLRFETMITPLVIEVIFWIAAAITIIAGIVTMTRGGWAVLGGFLILVLGPLVARIYCEILIIFFRINDHLRAIQHNTSHSSATAA